MNAPPSYVRDTAYPPHYHREMQPVWLASLAQIQGSLAPAIDQPYNYCELGCGLGINLLVAAACNPLGQFLGVDFNEAQLAFARKAAQAIRLDNVRFINADFARFGQQNSQHFDFIACHGVWSWIAPEQQAHILELVGKWLKPRGLLYLHYMCHPGATQMLPIQKLLNEVAAQLPGDSQQKVRAGLELLGQLDATGVFHDQPRLRASLQTLQRMNPAYLAHHFLSDHWQAQHSVDVHRMVASAGLSYLGSANVFENLDSLSIPEASQALLREQASPAIRELIKDMARHQHQRQDLFQRNPVSLPPQQHIQQVATLRFGPCPSAERSGGLTFATPIGEIQGPVSVFSPILQRLNAGPASFQELSRLDTCKGDLGLLAQSLQMLMWHGSVHPLRTDDGNADSTARRLQSWLDQQGLNLKVIAAGGTAIHPR
ncbi:class I SAM-dependent methyltransferase [Pseudomonas sp. SH1-B]